MKSYKGLFFFLEKIEAKTQIKAQYNSNVLI